MVLVGHEKKKMQLRRPAALQTVENLPTESHPFLQPIIGTKVKKKSLSFWIVI